MSEKPASRPASRAVLLVVILVAAGSVALAVYSIVMLSQPDELGPLLFAPDSESRIQRAGKVMDTEDGKQLLWANGPRDLEKGEWFDITGSPLDPAGYQFGIGKDAIAAIDEPQYVAIDDRERLAAAGLTDEVMAICYASGGEAKAFPIPIMNSCELVNDTVGGKPVTVGW